MGHIQDCLFLYINQIEHLKLDLQNFLLTWYNHFLCTLSEEINFPFGVVICGSEGREYFRKSKKNLMMRIKKNVWNIQFSQKKLQIPMNMLVWKRNYLGIGSQSSNIDPWKDWDAKKRPRGDPSRRHVSPYDSERDLSKLLHEKEEAEESKTDSGEKETSSNPLANYPPPPVEKRTKENTQWQKSEARQSTSTDDSTSKSKLTEEQRQEVRETMRKEMDLGHVQIDPLTFRKLIPHGTASQSEIEETIIAENIEWKGVHWSERHYPAKQGEMVIRARPPEVKRLLEQSKPPPKPHLRQMYEVRPGGKAYPYFYDPKQGSWLCILKGKYNITYMLVYVLNWDYTT
ncbi:hypothetical protein RFI_00880 [Reticulomyxa filosa]|uniref:Uncharacterized protein n=1 Tax=Reticulomyxa filosa TaxID=46433 RepID=X6PES2_RETFI|nr:hypothetical protein RFI_00880 [Reticulomyxa filosa]|eukprot:ETO36182.1 hypothetical protein RFI_00880 [Reticulomyxa filosa]